MKAKKLIISLLSITLLFSCNLLKKEISFYVKDSTTTTIPATIPINFPYNLPIPSITTSASQEYDNNNTTPDLISNVQLTQLTITITNPTNEDFSFLDEIYIYITYPDGSNEKLIASKTNINSSAQSIDLVCTEENLVPYLQQDSYKLKIKVKAKEALTHDVDIRIDLKFKITAQLLK